MFGEQVLRRIADLVLAQRGGLRKVDAQLGNERFAWQALALRLAVIKCHARGLIDNKALRLRHDDRQARLTSRSGWAGGHPRTLHLLREEAEAWARQPALRLALELGA